MQISSFSWEALQLFISFRSVTPPCMLQKDFEYGFKVYTRYLMTCDLITYLHYIYITFNYLFTSSFPFGWENHEGKNAYPLA